MVKIRKFCAYSRLERPYTRISKFAKKNFVRGGYPHIKITKFDMGDQRQKFDSVLTLHTLRSMQVRHNSLEAARMSCNRLLEKTIPNRYFLRIKTYPFHILRENPLASGAGADRMSQGMQKAFGKIVGADARVKEGQEVIELRLSQADLNTGRRALQRAAGKLPFSCKIMVRQRQ